MQNFHNYYILFFIHNSTLKKIFFSFLSEDENFHLQKFPIFKLILHNIFYKSNNFYGIFTFYWRIFKIYCKFYRLLLNKLLSVRTIVDFSCINAKKDNEKIKCMKEKFSFQNELSNLTANFCFFLLFYFFHIFCWEGENESVKKRKMW